jgi:hypothetical protein
MTGSDQPGDRLAQIEGRIYIGYLETERQLRRDDLAWLVAALVAERAQVDFQKRHALAAGLACTEAQKGLRAERAENEQLRRIFNHLTRYATFWNAVRFAEEHTKSLDEDVLTDADIAYLKGLPS